MESRSWFEKLAQRVSQRTLQHLEGEESMKLLRRHRLFADLTPQAFLFAYRHLIERRYAPNELIFREGNPGICLYIVKEGQVEIYAEDGGESGRRLVFDTVKEGGIFGEVSLIGVPHRTMSARTQGSQTVLLALSSYDLESICQQFPRDGLKLVRMLSRTISRHLVAVDQRLRAALHENDELKRKLADHA